MTVQANNHLPSDFRIRALRADDFEAFSDFFRGLSFRSRHQRLMSARRLGDRELRNMSQVDSHAETSFIAVTDGPDGEVVLGEARFAREVPGADEAELAVVVADQWQRVGLGSQLLAKLVDAGREQGLQALLGVTFPSNTPMRNLARKLGFRVAQQLGMASVALLRMPLTGDDGLSGGSSQSVSVALEAA